MSVVPFPNDEIKHSVYGLVLMLSSMYFEELDPIRKKIQGDLMGKVDCVRETCEESYNRGFSEGFFEVLEDVARNMLAKNFSDDEICELTGLPLERILKLKKAINPDCL